MPRPDSLTAAANCPYCGIRFSLEGVDASHTPINFERFSPFATGPRREAPTFTVTAHFCPDCEKPVMWLNEVSIGEIGQDRGIIARSLLWPKYALRPLSAAVPDPYRRAASEAAAVLEISPKASAALSRRNLQDVLRNVAKVKPRTLQGEIAELLERNVLPQYLANDLDAIRVVGNFAAHPLKDINTGEIVDVEPGEADWTLELLEKILEFYFGEMKRSTDRRDALNEKLRAAGKPPLR
jgi:hypothetical protein